MAKSMKENDHAMVFGILDLGGLEKTKRFPKILNDVSYELHLHIRVWGQISSSLERDKCPGYLRKQATVVLIKLPFVTMD